MRASYGLLLCMCAALTACNMALSEKPLFAERSSTIRLSDGLWAGSDPKCTVDLSSPKQQWPKCAGWFVLENSKVVAGSDMKSDEGAQDVFVVDGKPPLVQAVIKMSGPERSESYYGYFILEPKDRSSDGRIIAIELRPVPCGVEKTNGNIAPYPGFDKDCKTTSVPALRAAAARPPGASVEPMLMKWVRAEAK